MTDIISNERFVVADHIGARVEIYPHADGFRKTVKTSFGNKSAFVVDVIVLDAHDAETVYPDQLLFNQVIVEDLLASTEGEPLVGTLQRVPTAAGRTAVVVR